MVKWQVNKRLKSQIISGELTLCGPQDVYVQDDSLEDSSEGGDQMSIADQDVTMEDEV